MDLVDKYLDESTFKHNNPYVGLWFKEKVLYFKVPDKNSNVDKLYIWTGKKWIPMDNVKNPDKYTLDPNKAAMELLKKALPNLKDRIRKQNSEWKEYIKGY